MGQGKAKCCSFQKEPDDLDADTVRKVGDEDLGMSSIAGTWSYRPTWLSADGEEHGATSSCPVVANRSKRNSDNNTVRRTMYGQGVGTIRRTSVIRGTSIISRSNSNKSGEKTEADKKFSRPSCARPGEKTEAEKRFIVEQIRRVACFKCPAVLREKFAENIMPYVLRDTFPKGKEILFTQDSEEGSFYVVASGSWEAELVTRTSQSSMDAHPGAELQVLKKGAAFGDLLDASLFRRVRALEDSVVWVLDRLQFQKACEQDAREELEEHVGYLDDLDILDALTAYEKETIAKALHKVQFSQDDVVFQDGDEALAFYILLDGSVDLYSDEGKKLKTITGSIEQKVVQYFGDRALLDNEPRRWTVKVSSPVVTVLELEREDFITLLGPLEEIMIRKRLDESPGMSYVKCLDNLEILRSLSTFQKETLAQAMQCVTFSSGDVVYRCGDPALDFFVLVDGSLDVFVEGSYLKTLTASEEMNIAVSFGERALLENEPRKWTVKTTSQTAKVLKLHKDDFTKLLGDVKDVIHTRRYSESAHKGNIPRDKLITVGLIGACSFGPVQLCKHVDTGDRYALKRMGKGIILRDELQGVVAKELKILSLVASPFITRLYATYHGPRWVEFLFEFAQAGSLASLYRKKGFYGNNSHAVFYIAGMVYAIQHLQKIRVVHRDLKPEHIMVSGKGYPKLGGFSVSKQVVGKTFTTCGTPDYMAPEVLMGTGHSKAVDWWGLGVLVFELLAGRPPFQSATPMGVYSKVMRGIRRVDFPPTFNGDASACICALLKDDPMKRLGMRQQNIKEHAWFSGFNWTAMKGLSLDAPYQVSQLDDPMAVFAAKEADLPKQVPYVDDGSGWDRDFGQEVPGTPRAPSRAAK